MPETFLQWSEHGLTVHAMWSGDSRHPAPKRLLAITHITADEALQLMHAGTALVWRGDYHQGKQLLAAIKKRVRAKAKAPADFHTLRMQQAQQSRLFQMLLLVVEPGFILTNSRAPDVQPALSDVYDHANTHALLLPLHLLLGFIGAHEWHKTGVPIAALGDARIHVPYGVFSPLRGEYVDLLAQAPLPEPCHTAWDIGTGSGILAAVLAARGVPHITGTDTNARAITCAQANMVRLGYAPQVTIQHTDLFPEGQADLIVCNPPWLPAKPTADIETALYDPEHAMLQAFLAGAAAHLTAHGQVWLVMSDLAEQLGLRAATALPQWLAAAGLRVLHKTDTHPQHKKAQQRNNPLYTARSRETTSLWQLVAI